MGDCYRCPDCGSTYDDEEPPRFYCPDCRVRTETFIDYENPETVKTDK